MSESPNSQCIPIPETEEAWLKLAADHEASNLTVNNIQAMKSGSLVTVQQFLSFRVIWPKRKDLESFLRDKWILPEMTKVFEEKPAFNGSFEEYLDGIDRRRGPSDITGVFQLVRKYQMEVSNEIPSTGSTEPMSASIRMAPSPSPGLGSSGTPIESIERQNQSPAADPWSRETPIESIERQTQSPAAEPVSRETPIESIERQTQSPATERGSSLASTESSSERCDLCRTPAAEQEWQRWDRTTDEQYVNQALMAFLDAVTENLPEDNCHWGIRRLALKAEFKIASMEARTDGYLYGPKFTKGDAFAIVETKAHIRDRTREGSRIYMQESAEMVAWIFRDAREGRIVPLPRNQRLLVSQDRHEIWLTSAIYHNSYVEYLRNPNFGGRPFLEMEEVGPFNTLDSENMRLLAQFIGFFCSEVNDTIQKASASRSQT
ncbi:hypothetical protein CDV55_100036 [Aspergillus turcosus]|uniref:Uncharacterized protein n=1 Tax=Aspergillus turcosus TaxID=1245748 RepID=A0A397G2X9_9EURO|nr:hypothetical protein CDV55_100036 [Aspergillus turcosus]RLL92884.1 hypothetical protein CFD26_100024 [Aspergillus turcosus]